MCYPRVSLPHILTLVFLLPHPGALGCDPSFQMSAQEKVTYSKVVAQGTIVKHYPVTSSNPGQFVAELKIQCVFKDMGTRLPGVVNITNGGHYKRTRDGPNPGKCFDSMLTVGEDYVVFLRIPGTQYEAHTLEVKVKDTAYNEVTSACGMKVTDLYPEGLTEARASHKCPDIKSLPCPTTTPYVPTHRTKQPHHEKRRHHQFKQAPNWRRKEKTTASPIQTSTKLATQGKTTASPIQTSTKLATQGKTTASPIQTSTKLATQGKTTTSTIQRTTKHSTQGSSKVTKRVTMKTVTTSTTGSKGSRNTGSLNIQTVILSVVFVFTCYRV